MEGIDGRTRAAYDYAQANILDEYARADGSVVALVGANDDPAFGGYVVRADAAGIHVQGHASHDDARQAFEAARDC